MDFQSCYIKKANTDLVAVLFYCEYILRLECLLLTFKCALSDHVAYLSIYNFVRFWQVLNITFLLLLKSSLKLSRILSLFYNGNFVAMVNHFLQVLVKNFFREANM